MAPGKLPYRNTRSPKADNNSRSWSNGRSSEWSNERSSDWSNGRSSEWSNGRSSEYTPMPATKWTEGSTRVAANTASRDMAPPHSNTTKATGVTAVTAPTAAAATTVAKKTAYGGFRVNRSTVYKPHRESQTTTSNTPHGSDGEVEVGTYPTKSGANAALRRVFQQSCRGKGNGGTLEENEGGLQRCTIRDDAKGRVDLYWTSPTSERWTIVLKVEGTSVAEGSGGPGRSAPSPREGHGPPDRSLTATAASKTAGIGTELVPALRSECLGKSVEDASTSLKPSQNPQAQTGQRIKAEPCTLPLPLAASMLTSAPAPGVAPAPMALAPPPLPRPDRISAIPIARDTPRAQLSCMVRHTFGKPPVCDPSRVFTAEGRSCEEGHRIELASRLSPMVQNLAPAPGSLDWPQVMGIAEALEFSGESSDSLASRQKDAKAMLTEHVVALVHHHGLLLASNHCVLLHGVTELSAAKAVPANQTAPKGNDRPLEAGAAMAPLENAVNIDRTKGVVGGGVGAGAGGGQGEVGGTVDGDEDRAMLKLLLKQHPKHEMNAVLLPALKTLRNASGRATWFDFDLQLRAAAELTLDLGLEEERRILDTTMYRGQRLLDGGGDPKQVLFMFTEKLPKAHGVDQATLDQDKMALKAIVEASSGFVGAAGGGSGLAVTAAHAPLATAAHAPLVTAAHPPLMTAAHAPLMTAAHAPLVTAAHSPLVNVAHAPLNGAAPGATYDLAAHPPMAPHQGPPPPGAWAPIPPVAVYGAAAAPPPLPVLPLGHGRGGRSKAGKGGRGGQGPPAPPSNRDMLSRQRFNRQLEELQQTYLPVQGAPTCGNCTRAFRNPNHDYKLCAFSVCRKCKLAGHRANACTANPPL